MDFGWAFVHDPNDSNELKLTLRDGLDLEMDFGYDVEDEELEANITIDGTGKEDYGLNDEDLRNLLD